MGSIAYTVLVITSLILVAKCKFRYKSKYNYLPKGPVSVENAKCSTECLSDSKFEYSEQSTYIYSYEGFNKLHIEGGSQLSSNIKATIELTPVSKCEMILKLSEVQIEHGSQTATSSPFIDDLKRNVLQFSWNGGRIDNICPSADDKEDVTNIKRGILSALQNSMRSLEYDAFVRETDVLGSCDTEYHVKNHAYVRTVIQKTKNIRSCSNHHTLVTALMTMSYESRRSPVQDLLLLSDPTYTCDTVIASGIIEEVVCTEKAALKKFLYLNNKIEVEGKVKIKFASKKPAESHPHEITRREKLPFVYEPRYRPVRQNEVENVLRRLCTQTEKLVHKEAGSSVHDLVYLLRGLPQRAVERIYNLLKNKELCSSSKPLGIFLDALPAAGSEGAVNLMTKLLKNESVKDMQAIAWLTSLTFITNPTEGALKAALPLLRDFENKQAGLSVSVMAHRFCTQNPNCETVSAVSDLISSLSKPLKNKCQTSDASEEEQVILALKAFGNLGYAGESVNKLLECASDSGNSIPVRRAAIDAFRRTACSETVTSKFLELYENPGEDSEVRIAALIGLMKCPSYRNVKKVVQRYETETSKQVEVFTWSYFTNLKETSDPAKQKLRNIVSSFKLEKPHSVDVTKFSRNYEWTQFSELLNVGTGIESNLIFSPNSFVPRTGDVDFTHNYLGHRLNLLEFGWRIEDVDYALEDLFGPSGMLAQMKETMSTLLFSFVDRYRNATFSGINLRQKRSASVYQSRVNALDEKVNFVKKNDCRGSAHVRIFGNELMWSRLESRSFSSLLSGLDSILRRIGNQQDVECGRSFMFVDNKFLTPSVTGRAYKLATNGSVTIGLNNKGKFNIQQSRFLHPDVDIDGTFQPSSTVEISVLMSLHSEDYEPGVKALTTLHMGSDIKAKIELKEEKLLNIEVDLPTEKIEIYSLKRQFYEIDENSVTSMALPQQHKVDFCVKYLDKLLGLELCSKSSFPRVIPTENNTFVPFIGALESEMTVRKVDDKMQGFKFTIQLPGRQDNANRLYHISFDTPGSVVNRKYLAEVNMAIPEPNDVTAELQLECPFKVIKTLAKYTSRPDKAQFEIETSVDGSRKYVLSTDVDINVRGARLAEYKPTISLQLPGREALVISGTVIYSKGRKETLTLNLNSDSFAQETITVRGTLTKEGEFRIFDRTAEWKLISDVNVKLDSSNFRLHGSIAKQIKELTTFMGLDYQFEDGVLHKAKLISKIQNLGSPVSSRIMSDAEFQLSEYEDYNWQSRWDFRWRTDQIHLENDIVLKYGKDFTDSSKYIHLVHLNKFRVDFEDYQQMAFANKIGLKLPFIDFDKFFQLSTEWDFTDKPKFSFNFDLRCETSKNHKVEITYEKLSKTPLRMTFEAKLEYPGREIIYRDQLEEISPRELKGRTFIQIQRGLDRTIDYVYKIKSDEHTFHHEIDSTIAVSGAQGVPVQQKFILKITRDSIDFISRTEFGNSYLIDAKLYRIGSSKIKMFLPFLQGELEFNNEKEIQTFNADFQSNFKNYQRKILGTGQFTSGDRKRLTVEIALDADRSPEIKLVMTANINREIQGSVERHIVDANIDYIGAVTVQISGRTTDPLLQGPHYFRADFSGSMEPMSIILSHEIKDNTGSTVIQYLRNQVEKLRAEAKGKYIVRDYHFEIEGGIAVASPYKAFNGKEIYYKLLADSNDISRSFGTEYRLKQSPDVGYVGKLDYVRTRGWPGGLKSDVLIRVNQTTVYEGMLNLEYENGKYLLQTNVIPSPNRRFNLLTGFEYAANFASLQYSFTTTFHYLNSITVNALYDFRKSEKFDLQSNVGFNSHELYDLNATLSSLSYADFEGIFVFKSKLTPTYYVLVKGNDGNSFTKYTLSLKKNEADVISGTGELKRRRKGFTANGALKYQAKEFLSLSVNNEVVSPRERNYIINFKTPPSELSANIHWLKDKKTVTHNMKFCRTGTSDCFDLITSEKSDGKANEIHLSYKTSSTTLDVEYLVSLQPDSVRYYLLLSSGNKRYGYELKLGHHNDPRNVYFAIIIPTREMVIRGIVDSNARNFHVKLNVLADAQHQPQRILVIEAKCMATTQTSTDTEVRVSHPILEKPIELKIHTVKYETASRPLTAEIEFDYSTSAEDKIIVDFFIEKSDTNQRSAEIVLNMYHQNKEHQDFSLKLKGTSSSDEVSSAVQWKYVDTKNVNVEAMFRLRIDKTQKKFDLLYQRPKFDFNLIAVDASSESSIDDASAVDFAVVFNDKNTTAKWKNYPHNHCGELKIFEDNGELSRFVQFCGNPKNQTILSIYSDSFEDDSKVFDFSVDVVRKRIGMVNIRTHWNPEFLGGLMFELTGVIDDVMASGVYVPAGVAEKLSAIGSKMKTNFGLPITNFIREESTKLGAELKAEYEFLKTKATEYFEYFYSSPLIRQIVEMIISAMDEMKEDFCIFVEGQVAYLRELHQRLLTEARRLVEKYLDDYCDPNSYCKRFYDVFKESGLYGMADTFTELLASLPERIISFATDTEQMKTWLLATAERTRRLLEPLTNNRFVKKILEFVAQIFERFVRRYEVYIAQIPQRYQEIKEAITENEKIREIIEFLTTELQKLRNQLQQIDVTQKLLEFWQFLQPTYASLAISPGTFYRVNTVDGERGIVDVDVFFPVDISSIQEVVDALHSSITSSADLQNHDWKTLYVKLKRISDFNFLPPYSEQALIIGDQHYITFDKTFYDFAGECSYLLSRDFDDGNFSIIAKYEGTGATKSIIVLIKDSAIEVNSGNKNVKVDDEVVDLPFLSPDVVVILEGNTIIIEDYKGFTVKCHVVYNICTVLVSGWYFAKTGGLLGTYDYESSNDFRRPKGQIAHSVVNFAKSWEISKGCQTRNLAQSVVLTDGTEVYTTCSTFFKDSTSPLSACFSEVQPAEYFNLCLRHLSSHSDVNKALCNIAAAYSSVCERNYVELSLPAQCLICQAPDGSRLEHGLGKKFGSPTQKTADVIFVIEKHQCNNLLVRDLNEIARSIDRTLGTKEFSDNLYGVISYGGSDVEPRSHTIRGDVLFKVEDVVLTTQKLTPEEGDHTSADALEALKHAFVYYPLRSTSVKMFVLMSCSPCRYDHKSLSYPFIQQVMLEKAITLHVINNEEIPLKRASTKGKGIIGLDADTVYSNKDVTQPELVGEPSLRPQVSVRKDVCVALAQELNGSYFTTHALSDTKNWRSILSRRFLKTAKVPDCQYCTCTHTRDHVPQTVCHPCTIPRPRLPITVCKTCDFPRYTEAFISYVSNFAM